MARRVIGTLTVAVLLLGVGSARATAPASRRASPGPAASAATVTAFTLLPRHAIALWLHPTAAPITIAAAADGDLAACEVGTTFSRYWRGGCRRLVGGSVTLPTSGGAVHVGFRIVPVAARAIRVRRLRVQWHCVDHFFVLQPGSTKARVADAAGFDC